MLTKKACCMEVAKLGSPLTEPKNESRGPKRVSHVMDVC